MKSIIPRFGFIIRRRFVFRLLSFFRIFWFKFLGMKIGKATYIPKIYITWPNQVVLGSFCILEHGIYFKYDGIWKSEPTIFVRDNVFIGSNCEFNIRIRIEIGNNSLIASGCKFIDHDHGTKLDKLINIQDQIELPITIGTDVWIGFNSIILKGVQIGNGAVVAAGSVVTKSIAPLEVWAGVPARKIGQRGNS